MVFGIEDYKPSQLMDFKIDMVFSVIYTFALGCHSYYSYKGFKQIDMRNVYNYIIFMTLYLLIILRITTLLWSVFHDKNKDYGPYTLQAFIYFQIPFDLLNIAALAWFFQWLEVSSTL